MGAEGPPDWHLNLIEPLLSSGVRAVKLRIGTDYLSDLETLAAIREQLDSRVAVMIDGNENFTVSTALAIADQLGALGVVPHTASGPVALAANLHLAAISRRRAARIPLPVGRVLGDGGAVVSPGPPACGGRSPESPGRARAGRRPGG